MAQGFLLAEESPSALRAWARPGNRLVGMPIISGERVEQEDGPMDEFLAVGATPNGEQIYLSELSRQTLAETGMSSDVGGLYLYEASADAKGFGIRVLASVPCLEAGFRMLDLLGLRLTPA